VAGVEVEEAEGVLIGVDRPNSVGPVTGAVGVLVGALET